MSADLRDLEIAEARATGTLIGTVSTMLIFHEHGGEQPDHWARLRKAYDAYQACHGALIDCLYPPQAEPSLADLNSSLEGTIYAEDKP